MSDFIRVAKTSEIPDPGKMLVELGDRLVVLVHTAGQIYAIDDVCTHDGGPLSEGPLEGFAIACPRHGAKFDVRDGRALTMPATQPTMAHEVKIVGGEVFVKLRDENNLPPAVTTESRMPAFAAISSVPASTEEACSTPAPEAHGASAVSETVSEDAIREALKKVVDPELFVNIVDLGLIYLVDLQEAGEKVDVKVEMTMTSPACPAGPQLISQSKNVVSALPGVGNVEVKVVMIPPWTPDRMTEEARDQLGIF